MLRKGVYTYDYMDDCKKLNETLLPEKRDFYSHLNMSCITAADFTNGKRVCKDYKIKKLGVYHNLYVQRD